MTHEDPSMLFIYNRSLQFMINIMKVTASLASFQSLGVPTNNTHDHEQPIWPEECYLWSMGDNS